VVIAIIGILASLLLPSLSRAKNQAGKVTDLNNLKQIMVATHTYASDASDLLPLPNWGSVQSLGWLYEMDYTLSGPARYVIKKGLFWPTLGTPKVYVCPMDDPEMWHLSAHDGVTEQREQRLSSYAMNGAVVGYRSTNSIPEKLARFRPDDCAFWETDETEPYYFNDGANFPPEGVSARHSQGGIQAVFDGSVNYVRIEDWYAQVTETNRNRLWCYPETADGRGP
jgi:hypothetical protein